MKKNGKNEELQSRREFFKRAAKGALPILAGAALLSSPILSETANAMSASKSSKIILSIHLGSITDLLSIKLFSYLLSSF